MTLYSIGQDHITDAAGNNRGGRTWGRGIEIRWQNGPLEKRGVRIEPNGAFVEDVIQAAIGRLTHYQSTKFRCLENSVALDHLTAALHSLNTRTTNREARGVEGTNEL